MRGTTFAAAVAAAAVALRHRGAGHGAGRAVRSVAGVHRGPEQVALHRPHAHASRRTSPCGRASARRRFRPTLNPLTGQPYTFAADGFEATAYQHRHRPVRHAAGPARALGARVPGDRRAAGDLRRPPAGGHLDRQAAQDEGRLPPAGRRHHQVGEAARPDPGGLGRDGPQRLVQEVDDRRGEGQGAGRRDGLPGRRRSKAIQFLHQKRHILFHGHEPLDTDTTPTLEGEAWLMHHGYTQAEGVDNLAAVPGDGLPGQHRLPEVRRRRRRLRPLHRDLPARDQGRHEDLPRGRADEEAVHDPALGRREGHARPLTTDRAGRSGIGRPASHCRATRW